MNHTPEKPKVPVEPPAPKVKPCLWCSNSHVADAQACTCTAPCDAGWCLGDEHVSLDPFSWRTL